MRQDELIRPTTSTLLAANGTRISVLGEATVPFSTPYYETTITGLVSDHVAGDARRQLAV